MVYRVLSICILNDCKSRTIRELKEFIVVAVLVLMDKLL